MAAADRQYISAMQDLTITDQLESGIRALLIDAHYRETPDDPNFTWPTLGQMTNRKQRVVIFSEKNKALTAPNCYASSPLRRGDAVRPPRPRGHVVRGQPRRHRQGVVPDEPLDHLGDRQPGRRRDRQRAEVHPRPCAPLRGGAASPCRHRRGRLHETIGDVFGAVDELNGFKPGSGGT
jgi:hypothetical protein